MQTEVVRSWTCLPFIRSGHVRHSETGKKTRQTEEEVERYHHGMDRSVLRKAPDGSGEQRKMGETGPEVIFGVPTIIIIIIITNPLSARVAGAPQMIL